MSDVMSFVNEHPIWSIVALWLVCTTLVGIAKGLGPKAPKGTKS